VKPNSVPAAIEQMAAQRPRAIDAREPKKADREHDFPFIDETDLSLAEELFLSKRRKFVNLNWALGVER
jgi:hypothetical protein